MLNINHQKYRSISIFPKYFIDLDVMRLEGVSSGIPPDKFLLLTDFFHHVKHALMIEMVEEPNA